MNYIKVSEAAAKWNISARRVRILCEQNRIAGVTRKGNLYMIPDDAPKPSDARSYAKQNPSTSYVPLLEQIDALKARLNESRPLTPAEADAFREVFLVENTYHSNAIEGNTLTMQETALVLQGITIDQKPLKDHLEIVGYKDAFVYVEELAKSKEPLSAFELKRIHSLVLSDRPEDRGTFRRVKVRIAGASAEPVEPYLIETEVSKLLSDFASWAAKRHIVESVALFHLRFESIHPFIDGNGRTGRLLMNLQLVQNGLPPISVKFADRRRYYDAFDAYTKEQNATPMIQLIGEAVVDRLRQMLDAIGK